MCGITCVYAHYLGDAVVAFLYIWHQFVVVMDWCGIARQQRKYLYHGEKYPPYHGSHIVGSVYDVDDDRVFDALPRARTVVDCTQFRPRIVRVDEFCLG